MTETKQFVYNQNLNMILSDRIFTGHHKNMWFWLMSYNSANIFSVWIEFLDSVITLVFCVPTVHSPQSMFQPLLPAHAMTSLPVSHTWAAWIRTHTFTSDHPASEAAGPSDPCALFNLTKANHWTFSFLEVPVFHSMLIFFKTLLPCSLFTVLPVLYWRNWKVSVYLIGLSF